MADEARDRYMTIQAVAEMLSCTERHIYDLIREGALQAIKVSGRMVRISEQSLNTFIETRRIDPESLYDPEMEQNALPIQPAVARSVWMSTKKPFP
jgi:excisionase family DNA binding protein